MRSSAWILTAILGLILSGCNEYTASICKENVRADVNGFEGSYRFATYDQDTSSTESSSIEIRRIEKGVYGMGDSGSSYTCLIDGKLLIESKNDQTQRYSSYFLVKSDNGWDLQFGAFDRSDLDSSKIPYQVANRTLGTGSTLVVDNSQLKDPSRLGTLLKPLSQTIKLFQAR